VWTEVISTYTYRKIKQSVHMQILINRWILAMIFIFSYSEMVHLKEQILFQIYLYITITWLI
jgi:hypothetical protein